MTWNSTKIVATMGPACDSRKVLSEMIRAGVDVIRINGAHGDFDSQRAMIRLVRKTSEKLGVMTAILYDLPGPKLRLGDLNCESLKLKTGQLVVLACGKNKQVDDRIPMPDRCIARAVKKGGRIFINDGIVELRVKKVLGYDIECRVVSGGEIRSRKGVNLPRAKLPIPALTVCDKKLLAFALKEKIDYLGLSFVRSSRHVKTLRRLIDKKAPHTGIVAKIEKPEALDDLDGIIRAADAVMIARGDLGIEMPFDQLPVLQRRILQRCLHFGKPAIVATQMMESMVISSRPTRAEATDIASAIWGGTDAIMLSEETSIGKHPVKAVAAMVKIATQAERAMPDLKIPAERDDTKERQAQLLSNAAGMLADELGAAAIVTPTRSGRTPLFVSRMRPKPILIAPTDNTWAARKMQLYWGVEPIKMPEYKSVGEMLLYAEKVSLKAKLIRKGDTIVVVSGAHSTRDDITRLVEVRHV
jgi:pyruvate kinase